VVGVVTSTSLMVLAPAAERAAGLAREHPQLSVGLHFVDERLDQPARRFARQLARFRELIGRDPTHVDSHHHVHMRRMATFRELARPLRVPLRGDGQVRYIGGFWGQSEDRRPRREQVSVARLIELVRTQAGGGFSELGCHPGRVTPALISSYLDERATELTTLTAPGLRAQLQELGVQLVSYNAWVGLSTG
jgi:chitin disaccharide deacetylase